MTSSRSRNWSRLRDLEDILAILNAIETRRRIIRAHAWRGRTPESLDAIFDEATAMARDITELRETLGDLWKQLHEVTQ